MAIVIMAIAGRKNFVSFRSWAGLHFHLLSVDVGLLMGCALNGHDLLRGFDFGGHANRDLFLSLKECFSGGRA